MVTLESLADPFKLLADNKIWVFICASHDRLDICKI